MALDVRTLFTVMAATCLVVALALSVVPARHRDGTYRWSLGWAVQGIAWLLVGLRGVVWDFLSTIVAAALLVASIALIHAAVRKHQERPCRGVVLLIPPLATALFFSYFLIVDDNIAYRALFFTGLVTVQLVSLAWVLFTGARGFERRPSRLAGLAFLVLDLILLSRLLEGPDLPYGGPPLGFPAPLQYIRAITSFGMVLLANISFLLMTRLEAETRLQESEEQYRLAIECSNDGVVIARNDRHLLVNRRYLEMFGYDDPAELSDKAIDVVVHPEERPIVGDYFRRGQRGEDVPVRYGFRGMRKDGSTVHVEASTSLVSHKGQPAVLTYLTDVTGKIRIEEQLRQAQKMEAIGVLAGGVAHDFNNILTVIIGLGDLMQREMTPGDRLRPYVDQILLSSEKAADLTRSLLAFGRKQPIIPSPHRLSDVITDGAALLRRLLPEDIALKLDLLDDGALAMIDATQINQVLMNLATNGRDAMPGGGTLTLETRLTEMDAGFVKDHGFGAPGRYILLSVSDTGSGMDEETMKHAFDPFFTTKGIGKGTGLGLASVYGIVKQHGGYVTVRSVPGRGTTFDIFLPILEEADLVPSDREAPVRGGSETILVIEDDADVRRMVCAVLSEQGYRCLAAADGTEAIAVFRERRTAIDLVILDIVMPGRNGHEVFAEITRIEPTVRAIFVSGYSDDVITEKGFAEDVDFLQKPLTTEKLLSKVREVLER